MTEIVVTARRLDSARQTIQPALGASTYALSKDAIQALPGGDNAGLNQVVLQMPGVVQDSFGQLHVRDDHGNLQYRLNGVILPEGLSAFGQVLSPRLAENVQLITGALPAQYGLRTAGIIDIKTRSGLLNGGQIGVYGGSHGQFEPSLDYGGSSGPNSYFLSASLLRSQLGVESPDGRSTPLHDRTTQGQAFGYFEHVIAPSSRLTLIAGAAQGDFQIPNRAGQSPGLGLTVLGQTDYPSARLNQTQREATDFATASYLHAGDRLTGQVSVFGRYSSLDYSPDGLGELLFNGIAQTAHKRDAAAGLQADGVLVLSDRHTLRAGLGLQIDRSTSATVSQVLPTDPMGVQTSDVPITLLDTSARTSATYSLYIQDEWQALPSLTVNYGLRFDALNAYRNETQLSPRINAVWTPGRGATVHLGYARYFTPPPFELVASASVNAFTGTTAQPAVLTDTTPYAERTDYLDLGLEQKIGAGLTLGADAYLRRSHNLIDEGQFGAPIIQTPFNYRDGKIEGVELSATYARGPITAYANLAISKGQGRDIISSQFNFGPADLAYIANHFIYLDHDQHYTASAGAAYRWGATRLSGDLLYGSGLRADGATPNGAELPAYLQVNASLTQTIKLAGGPLGLRLDVINLLDRKYEIRDGTGVGVGAPQWGPRRGVFAGLTKAF